MLSILCRSTQQSLGWGTSQNGKGMMKQSCGKASEIIKNKSYQDICHHHLAQLLKNERKLPVAINGCFSAAFHVQEQPSYFEDQFIVCGECAQNQATLHRCSTDFFNTVQQILYHRMFQHVHLVLQLLLFMWKLLHLLLHLIP